MVRHITALVVVGMCFSLVILRAEPQQEVAQPPAETTVTGCLQAVAGTDEFELVNDEKTTYRIQAADGVEIAPHVNHRVELSGTTEMNESTLIFKAKALTMVSASCAP
jgi:hypothetical protein